LAIEVDLFDIRDAAAEIAGQLEVPELGTGPARLRDPEQNATSRSVEQRTDDVG